MCVLTAIRIPPSIRRAQQSCRIHLPPMHVLVLVLSTIDARCACAITLGDIAALDHELIDHAVEGCFRVRQAIVVAGTELAETEHLSAWQSSAEAAWSVRENRLLACFGCLVGEELDGQPAGRMLADVHVEKHTRAMRSRHVSHATYGCFSCISSKRQKDRRVSHG